MGDYVQSYGFKVVLGLAFLFVAYSIRSPRRSRQAVGSSVVTGGRKSLGTSWPGAFLRWMLFAAALSELPGIFILSRYHSGRFTGYEGQDVVGVLAFLAVAYWLRPPRSGRQAVGAPEIAGGGGTPETSWPISLLWPMLLAVVFWQLPVALSVPVDTIRDFFASMPNDSGAHVIPQLYWVYCPLVAFLVGFMYIDRAPRIRGAVIPILANQLAPGVIFCFSRSQHHWAALYPRATVMRFGELALRTVLYVALALLGAWVWTRMRERPKANEVRA